MRPLASVNGILGFTSHTCHEIRDSIITFGLLHNLDPVEVVYFNDQGGVPLMRNSEVVKRPADPAELTERYTDEAIEFIERNRQRPFFLFSAPHHVAQSVRRQRRVQGQL